MLRIWKDHFSKLYNGDDEPNSSVREIEPLNLGDADQQFRLPDLDEVKIAIS